jgi:PEP-CTERM motif
MKKFLGHAVAVGAMLLSAQTQAVPLLDHYIGSKDNGWGDVIGDKALFDTDRMEITRENGKLQVDIFTNFVGHVGVYPGLTLNGKGIGYGDLLLGGEWMPFVKDNDNSAANIEGHKFDNATNGTHWEYGLSFDNPWSTAANGTFTLYKLNGTNLENLILSEELFKPGAIVRQGQAVHVDRTSLTVEIVDGGTWSTNVGEKRLSFELDLSLAQELANWEYLSLHWGMTCNNDAIEGGVELPPTVPEPTMLSLIGLGLAGLVVPVRRRRQPR